MNKKWILMCVLVGILTLLLFSSPQAFSSSPNSFTSTFYQLPSGIPDQSSPTLADITGDGVPEILVGSTAYNGETGNRDQPTLLMAISGNGSILWSQNVNAPMNSSPAVGDIDNDGEIEIVVSVGGDVADKQHPGGIIAYESDGTQSWRFDTVDYDPDDGFGDGVYSSPTLCDVDNNGDMEIAFGSWDQRIYLLDHNGNSLWNNAPGSATGQGYFNVDTVWSTAACADLNNDDNQEIIIGADITGGGFLPDGSATEDGGFLYVFDKDGNVLVRRFLNEVIYSSPAVGDLDGNGTIEIVTGTGWLWWYQRGRTDSSFVYAFDTSEVFGGLHYADSAKLPHLSGWPKETPYPGFSSPALADLDGDNDLEVIIGTGDPLIDDAGDINGTGSVYAWHHTGEQVSGWPVFPKNASGEDTTIFSSPTVADVDNDGQLEVLFSMIWDIHVYNANGTFQERLDTAWTIWSSPAIGDTDNDNYVDVWIATGNAQPDQDQSKGYLWHFEQTTSGIGAQPWPQLHRDAANSGYYPSPGQLMAPTELFLMHQQNSEDLAYGSLILRNSGDSPLNFTIGTLPDRIEQVSPASGQIAGDGQVNLSVQVNTLDLSQGNHQLGNLDIYDAGTSLLAQVAVRVYLGDLTNIYLPLMTNGQSNSSVSEPDLIYWTYNNIPLSSGHIINSAPIAADLDGDGMDEIIVASSDQKCENGSCSQNAPTLLTVTRNDGTSLWSKNTGGIVSSTPAVADINQDGSLEVVVTVGTDPYGIESPGHVIVYSAQGDLIWQFETRDKFGNGTPDGIFSSPTLCDLNGDGYLEVIFGGLDSYIYALHSHGEVMWEHENGWEVRSTAACADLNADRHREVIIGGMSDPSVNGTGGYLYVFSSEGQVLARRSLPEAIHSSPVVGDLDGSGQQEIVVGTSATWWDASTNTPSPQVYAFDTSQLFSGLSADDSAKLPDVSGWPQTTEYPSDASPALADLDLDGTLEVLIGTAHPTLNHDGVVGAGNVYAWHHNGQLVNGWPVYPKNSQGDDTTIRSSPVIADIDQDRQPEVILTMLWDVLIYNANGTEQFYATQTGYTVAASPVVADTDKDGKIEVWIGGSRHDDQTQGYLWAFESKKEGFGELMWPMFRQNASNTGTP